MIKECLLIQEKSGQYYPCQMMRKSPIGQMPSVKTVARGDCICMSSSNLSAGWDSLHPAVPSRDNIRRRQHLDLSTGLTWQHIVGLQR